METANEARGKSIFQLKIWIQISEILDLQSSLLSFPDEIVKSTGNENVFVKKLDLSSQASIRDFSKDILSTEARLDVLIHNAGYGETFKRNVSVDGIGKRR